MMVEILSKYWEAIIACLAFVVSVATAKITYRTFSLQRTHNYKSLKPFLYVAPYDYENCLKILLRNEGVGPAVVKKIRVYKNEYEVKPCVYDWLPKKLPVDMNYKEYFTRSGDFVLKQGGCETMIEIPVNMKNEKQVQVRETIRGILRELTVIIEYQDVYENEMPAYKRSLKLYARPDNEN